MDPYRSPGTDSLSSEDGSSAPGPESSSVYPRSSLDTSRVALTDPTGSSGGGSGGSGGSDAEEEEEDGYEIMGEAFGESDTASALLTPAASYGSGLDLEPRLERHTDRPGRRPRRPIDISGVTVSAVDVRALRGAPLPAAAETDTEEAARRYVPRHALAGGGASIMPRLQSFGASIHRNLSALSASVAESLAALPSIASSLGVQHLAVIVEPPPEDRAALAGSSSEADPQQLELQLEQLEQLEPPAVAEPRTTGTVSSVFNLCNTMLGAGFLAFPAAVARCGFALGTAILFASAVLCALSMYIITLCCKETGFFQYKHIASRAFGRAWVGRGIDAVIVLYGFLITVLYNSVVATSSAALFEAWFDAKGFWVTMALRVAINAAVMVPLALLKDLGPLRMASLLVVLAVVFTTVVLGVTASAVDAETIGDRLAAGPASAVAVVIALPIFLFGFSAHLTVSRIYEELSFRTVTKMVRVIAVSVAIVAVLYLCVSLSGIASFGPGVQSNVIDSYPISDNMASLCRALMLVVVCLSYPVILFAARRSLLNFIAGAAASKTAATPVPFTRKQFYWYTAAICSASFAVSVVFSDLGVVVGLAAALAGSLLVLVLPGAFFLRIFNTASARQRLGSSYRYLRMLAIFFIGYGVCLCSIGVLKTLSIIKS